MAAAIRMETARIAARGGAIEAKATGATAATSTSTRPSETHDAITMTTAAKFARFVFSTVRRA